MPNESSVFDIAIQGHFEGVRGMEKLHKAIAEASKDLGAMNPRTLKRLQSQIDGVAKSFNDALGKAGSRDLGKLTARVRDNLDRAGAALRDQFASVRDAAKQMEDAQKNGSVMAQEAAKATLDAEKKKFDQLERRLKKEASAIDAMIERRKSAEEFLSRGGGEIGADLADAFADGLGKLSSGDVRGLTEAVAGGLKTAGSVAGAGGGGAAVAKLGTAAVALSGAVMAIAAIVKILVDADSQTKDFNKSLLETAGAADFATDRASGGFKDLEGDLRAARSAAFDLGFEFRQMPEDMLKTLSAANAAGFTFQEMADKLSDSGDSGEAFRNMMRDSLIYAKTLGVSTEEIAQMTASWMHDFGGGLDTIREGYSAIFQASLEAGIGSKRFFTMVQQATAGLALYNVRVEQTAALIADLSDAMGEEDAASLVQNLQKGFTDESMQDRMKRIMTSGGAARRVISADAKATMGSFRDRTSGNAGVASALAAAGVQGDNQEMLKGLADLTAKDRRALVRRVTEYDKQAGQQLSGLIDLAAGMEGGIGAQAQALDNLSAGGKLAMQLQSAMGVIGTPLSEMTAIEQAGFEQMTGIQGEALEQLKRADQKMRADYELAKEQGKTDKTLEDYIISRGDEFQDAIENTQPIMEQMTGQLVSNSESMLNLLSTTFKYMLENISQGINIIAGWAGGLDASDREAQGKWLQKLAERREGLTSEIFDLKKQIEKSEGPEKVALQDKLAKAEDLLAQTREGERKVRGAQEGLLGLDVGEAGFARLAGDMVGYRDSTGAISSRPGAKRRLDTTSEAEKFLEQQEAQRKEDAKKQLDETGKMKEGIDDLPKDTARQFGAEIRRMDAEKLLGAAGMSFENEGQRQAFLDKLGAGNVGARNQLQAALQAKKGLSSDIVGLAQGFNINPSVDDFIMRGNTVTPIHRADQLMGAKPGGPVDRGGRGGNTFNFHIDGGNQAEVYQTVKKALREAGIRPSPGRRG